MNYLLILGALHVLQKHIQVTQNLTKRIHGPIAARPTANPAAIQHVSDSWEPLLGFAWLILGQTCFSRKACPELAHQHWHNIKSTFEVRQRKHAYVLAQVCQWARKVLLLHSPASMPKA